MEPLALKKAVIEQAIQHLEELQAELRDTADMQLHAGAEDDESIAAGSFGSGDSGNEDMSKEKASFALAEADKVQEHIRAFRNYRFEKTHEEVEHLALVETNKGKFFITRAVKPVEYEGEKYIFIEEDAPVYSSMEGKRAGDTFSFNGNDFQIRNVL